TLYDWDSTPNAGPGSEFALYDESWKLVWSLPLPGDFKAEDDRDEFELINEMREHGGGMLDTKSDLRFELRQVAKSERVTYEVARDPTATQGWSVREVARAPFKVEPKKAVELAKLTLPAAGKVQLDVGVQDTSGPVRDIKEFRVDPTGGITFVRGESTEGAAALVTLDSSGSVLRQVAVVPIEPSLKGMRHWHALEAGDWLVTIQPWDGERPPTRAWRVRGETGAAVELTAFSGPSIEAIEPATDGGFVMLGLHSLEYTSQKEVRRCAADGSTLWSHQEFGYGQCENISDVCSAEDIAVDKDGSVFVLDQFRKLVQIFDGKGVFVRAIDLEKSWESESTYLTDLILEPAGSILIHDFHGVPMWHRVTRDGKELATFTAGRDLRVDGGGKLWSDDSHQIFEYDAAGVVHERFGSAADPMRLSKVDGTFYDGAGRVALSDDRTHSIHIFTPDGKRAVLCIPDPTEADSDYDAVIAAPDGTIYVQPGHFYDSYLAFASDGQRIGSVKLGGQYVAFNPRTKERWAAGEDEDDSIRLRRFDAEGKLVFETDRRPDGGFFEGVKALACAPDGSIVLLEGPSAFSSRGGPGVLCFYGPKGEPQRQLVLPGDELEYERFMQVGRRFLVISGFEPSAFVISLSDGKCRLFEASDQEASMAIGLSPDESELWAVESTVLHRFTLPK
ncbi:MAG TPA: hypothetical protein VK843_01940, partial [Planctomycetota bacterium]|nr:hypothetical protein [Planctomycetota bacterium]